MKQHEVNGWVKAVGSKLVNGEGQELILRGVGFGSWLLPEGYMWRFPEQGDRPRRIEQMVRDLIGDEKAKQFWETYYERYITEADIQKIAEEGFNSVRIPILARFLYRDETYQAYHEEHFRLLDRVIEWCKTHRLYVILDLHGAPGGQTGTNIDDSKQDLPELFIHEEYQRITIDLWRTLAQRYKDEWIVAGYDLLNEPLPEWFAEYNDRVMPLYKEIVKAIREVDDRHMIILEGVHWATDWSIFNERIDDNLMLQFHKYWNNPDTASIQKYLDKRDEWNVPIFMGEGGENNKEWYVGAFRLFEDHGISWNFWTWKKMDTTNSPCSIRRPDGWGELVGYLEGRGRPDAQRAEEILNEYLDHLLIERCVYHPEVVNALFSRPPVRIPAIFYGYEGEGRSYGVTERSNEHVGFRIEDGTRIRFIEGERTVSTFQHGGGQSWKPDERLCVELLPGDWLAYKVQIEDVSESFKITLRGYAVEQEGLIQISAEQEALGTVRMQGQTWSEQALESFMRVTGPGTYQIQVKVLEGIVRLEWLEIRPSGE